MPKKAFYVSYVMADRMTTEDLEAEKVGAKYISRLEESACSLRLNVFTPGKARALALARTDHSNIATITATAKPARRLPSSDLFLGHVVTRPAHETCPNLANISRRR